MNTHTSLLRMISVAAITAAVGVAACATHERVVVRDRPEVVRVQTPPPPVVEEKVIVRP